MAFSSNYRAWRTVAMATLQHAASEHATENTKFDAGQPAPKTPVKGMDSHNRKSFLSAFFA